MSLPQNPFTSSTRPSMKKSPSLEKEGNQMHIKNVDRISKLPDDMLLKIIKSLSTEEAVQTSLLSKRWEGVWKQMPYLFFDMKNALKVELPLAEQSHFIAQLITKVINNHSGNLEHCKILHMTPQTQDGTLETWIRSLIHVKHTKCLELKRFRVNRPGRARVLHLPPNIFSHPMLTSLLLSRYQFESAHAFNNCNNLIILKLFKFKVEGDVLNTVIASCPSLKMLVLEIFQNSRTGCLKIHNNNLKFVHLTCTEIDNVEVSAALLDILSIHNVKLSRGVNIVLDAPRLLQFSQRLWKVCQSLPHIVYNISCDTQGNENIGHEFVMNIENYFMVVFATLAVNVDMMNPKEVYMLKQVLEAWARDLQILQIFFKDNDIDKKEGESSIDGIQNKWGNYFFDIDFCVKSVFLYNFNGSDEDQFALAASFVIQGKMMESLTIDTSSLPANKTLAIDTVVAKLMKLPKGNKNLNIKYI
ncbi:putative F-box protein At1g67390 [Brassica rapa]|uniref:putative F-box protein At1g67390 n=1 Tax=Brassica campestris TaxID=3711 RepID=UPI00142E8E52|nr:putative F-box protein At1g67390 [Brassica rapa]